MSQSVVMNNLERLFALEPRHFPLPWFRDMFAREWRRYRFICKRFLRF
uniref:Uncharacterized protein n=1 Tax=Parascaris equorum TaxID=6256 RepID=A0A914RLR8_PAREQ